MKECEGNDRFMYRTLFNAFLNRGLSYTTTITAIQPVSRDSTGISATKCLCRKKPPL